MELPDLIKKFTTLVGIATSSSLTYLISIVLNWKVSFEFAGDHGLNMMCMWMLLGSSNKYWDWCKTYGLCKCCHRWESTYSSLPCKFKWLFKPNFSMITLKFRQMYLPYFVRNTLWFLFPFWFKISISSF